MNIPLNSIRRAQKIKIKDIPLDPKTVHKIEAGTDVSTAVLKVYLEAVGLQLTFSLK